MYIRDLVQTIMAVKAVNTIPLFLQLHAGGQNKSMNIPFYAKLLKDIRCNYVRSVLGNEEEICIDLQHITSPRLSPTAAHFLSFIFIVIINVM